MVEQSEDPMQDIIIQRGGLDDLDRIRQLAIDTFTETFLSENTPEDIAAYIDEHFNLSTITQQLSSEHMQWYLALYHGRPVGYMKVNFDLAQTEQEYPHSLEVQRIYVLKAYKRMHIGTLLMQQAIDLAREHKLHMIWLGVWEHNTRAIQFYARLGFKQFGEHHFTLGHDIQHDYLMKLSLLNDPFEMKRNE
jgi:ribosomal protein S18 acetylase RimI-like enzyme